ncbi:MAG: preprotein translocase subunit YajC [Bacteroidaceae bacterium]|jgi:preprotein translocase subunit YajC|nr:preprotein translocase subunit YajC [Bacteroidaceae bacterium]HPB03342.1 preprotein translocase subunit YajC [Bacteroidaceae bacterium]HQL26463.1 preprotein translocase subunit YajC [Bacteroidaceae bacterium]
MAKMLLIDPFMLTAHEVESVNENIVTLVQQDVNLGDIQETQTGQGRGGGMGGMMWIILLFLIMMMLFMRPRQDKEGDKFRNSLQRDQDVITSSGIFGKVKEVDDVSVTIEIAQGMKIKVDKRYVNPIPTAQPVKPEREKLFGRKKKDPSKDEKA